MTGRPTVLPSSLIDRIAADVGEERMAWFLMSPAERWAATAALWANYLALGGRLDPDPDPLGHGGLVGGNEALVAVARAPGPGDQGPGGVIGVAVGGNRALDGVLERGCQQNQSPHADALSRDAMPTYGKPRRSVSDQRTVKTPIIPLARCSAMWQCIIHLPGLDISTRRSTVPPTGISTVSFQTRFSLGTSLWPRTRNR